VADDRDAHARVGFAYMPRLDPSRGHRMYYTYISNGWWEWRQGG
jgi:hypothetical protein